MTVDAGTRRIRDGYRKSEPERNARAPPQSRIRAQARTAASGTLTAAGAVAAPPCPSTARWASTPTRQGAASYGSTMGCPSACPATWAVVTGVATARCPATGRLATRTGPASTWAATTATPLSCRCRPASRPRRRSSVCPAKAAAPAPTDAASRSAPCGTDSRWATRRTAPTAVRGYVASATTAAFITAIATRATPSSPRSTRAASRGTSTCVTGRARTVTSPTSRAPPTGGRRCTGAATAARAGTALAAP